MLFGEHAVLRGHTAVVCAVNQHMHVHLTPQTGSRISLRSDLGTLEADLDALPDSKSFRFVLAAIRALRPELSSGFSMSIHSDFSPTVGLGSSAAVTAATVAALHAWTDKPVDADSLFPPCLDIIRSIQGTGSGADLAASLYGGTLAYRAEPRHVRPLNHIFPITVVYSGYKTPTVNVIQQVDQQRQRFPELYHQLDHLINNVSERAAQAIEEEDWPAVGELMSINQGLMDALGVNAGPLSEIVYGLRADPGILGSKLSGSGLGDCVIGLGDIQSSEFLYPTMPIQMSRTGVRVERL
jgi:mevalonate kinase